MARSMEGANIAQVVKNRLSSASLRPRMKATGRDHGSRPTTNAEREAAAEAVMLKRLDKEFGAFKKALDRPDRMITQHRVAMAVHATSLRALMALYEGEI